jgi:hypothetical protein
MAPESQPGTDTAPDLPLCARSQERRIEHYVRGEGSAAIGLWELACGDSSPILA